MPAYWPVQVKPRTSSAGAALTGERGFDAAFIYVAGNELAQAPPIDVANPVGAQVSAVAQDRDALGDGHHFVQPVANEDGGNSLPLQLVNGGQQRFDLLVC